MNARKLADYYRAIADAEEALAACPKSVEDIPVAEKADPAALFRDAVVSARNVVLANDPRTPKGELLGTIATEPTAAASPCRWASGAASTPPAWPPPGCSASTSSARGRTA